MDRGFALDSYSINGTFFDRGEMWVGGRGGVGGVCLSRLSIRHDFTDLEEGWRWDDGGGGRGEEGGGMIRIGGWDCWGAR